MLVREGPLLHPRGRSGRRRGRGTRRAPPRGGARRAPPPAGCRRCRRAAPRRRGTAGTGSRRGPRRRASRRARASTSSAPRASAAGSGRGRAPPPPAGRPPRAAPPPRARAATRRTRCTRAPCRSRSASRCRRRRRRDDVENDGAERTAARASSATRPLEELAHQRRRVLGDARVPRLERLVAVRPRMRPAADAERAPCAAPEPCPVSYSRLRASTMSGTAGLGAAGAADSRMPTTASAYCATTGTRCARR